VGILCRPGPADKSTFALSSFHIAEATEGRTSTDDIDISNIGLTDGLANIT
ncbi:hypothetical protein EDD15DRAFT_2109090, partial [Pisolithus albus]